MAKTTAGDESVTFRIYDHRLNSVACDKKQEKRGGGAERITRAISKNQYRNLKKFPQGTLLSFA